MISYENYKKLEKLLKEFFDMTPYEINLIHDIIKFCDELVGKDNYDQDEVIKFLLDRNYSGGAVELVNWEVYLEVKTLLGLKEIDEEY